MRVNRENFCYCRVTPASKGVLTLVDCPSPAGSFPASGSPALGKAGEPGVSLNAPGAGSFSDGPGAEVAQIARFVPVDVDGNLVLFGHADHDVQVVDRDLVQRTGMDAAHHIRTGFGASF